MAFYRFGHASSTAVAALLPKNTLAFVHLPDLRRTESDFHQTDLYRLWSEPAVQEFLQKPSTKIPRRGELGSAASWIHTGNETGGCTELHAHHAGQIIVNSMVLY